MTEINFASKNINNKTLSALFEMWKVHIFVLKNVWSNSKKGMLWTISLACLVAFLPYLRRGAEALLINYLTINFGSNIFTPELLILILAVPTVILINGFISSFYDFWDILNWRKIRVDLEILFSKKMASLDVATHEDPKFRDKIQLLEDTGQSWVIANFYSKFTANIINIIGFFVAAIIMLNIDWRILVIVVLATIPRFIVEMKYGEEIWGIYQTKSQDKRHLSHASRQIETVEGITELQTYQTTNFFVNRIKNILEKFYNEQKIRDKKAIVWKIGAQAIVSLSFGVIIWFLINPVLSGTMQIGTFVFVLAAAVGLQESVIGFFLMISRQYQDIKSVSTFMELLKEEKKVVCPINSFKLSLNRAPEIVFENVSFAYASKPEIFILKNLNLTIKSGEKLALVGTNGAGKSTFIKLLCRFYDPTEGRILIDGVDLKEIDLSTWYKYVALLSQDYVTYKFLVKDLIHLGKDESPMDQTKICDAAIKSDADEFIQKWEKSYDQQVGVEFDGGVDPSRGQKQKLALARALFRNAFVTILDEPTASVDATAEKQIFEQLEKTMSEEKTLILISHRFATVRNADKIAVIDGQSVKEYGTHSQLIRKNGIYKKLYSAQAAGYKK
jgi:ATP-binding cassette, subfamily B, bacterial